jgi:hypothetical protein
MEEEPGDVVLEVGASSSVVKACLVKHMSCQPLALVTLFGMAGFIGYFPGTFYRLMFV